MANSTFGLSTNPFRWTVDPTFYPTARLAMEAPAERYAYVAGLTPDQKSRPDALMSSTLILLLPHTDKF
jgi:hypothetical protein